MKQTGWCLVMCNNKVTGKVSKDYFDAVNEQIKCPVHTIVLYGVRDEQGNFIQA